MNEALVDSLTRAIRDGDRETVASLANQHREVLGERDAGGLTPLMTAIYWRNPEMVDLLRAVGAPVELVAAAALGDTERLGALIGNDPAAINRHSGDGFTPLALAAHFGQREAVRLLLDRGADVEARSTNALKNTALHAALAGGQDEIARLLVEHEADVNAGDAHGNRPLHLAAESGLVEAVRLLLAAGADPDATNDAGQRAADLAQGSGHLEILKLLGRSG